MASFVSRDGILTGIRNFSATLAIFTATLACACLCSSPAAASRLDDAACDALKAERARIETDALKSDMQKGPAWAKDNVSPERLKEIEQVIGLDESIAFRCQQPKSVAVPVHAAKANPGAAGGTSAAPSTEASVPEDEEAPGATTSASAGAAATVPAAAGKKKKSAGAKKPAAITGAAGQTLPVEKPAADKPKSKANKATLPKPVAKLQKSKPKADAFTPPAKPLPAQNPPPASGEASAATPGAALSP